MQTRQDRWGTGEAAVCEQSTAVRPRLQVDAASGPVSLDIGLLTGGQDRHYAVGLGTALMEQNVALDVIGSDEIDGPEFQGNPRVRFRNLHGDQQSASLARRISRILVFYARMFRYATASKPKIFHILWNNKLQLFDRTLLMLFYKLAGKKVVLTAHNVNAGRRDKKDSWLNRSTLKCQYKLADHIFVHTKRMKDELVGEFDVKANKVTIIPYGINNAVPFTELTSKEARRKLALQNDEKVILYFGAIKDYKGLEYLVAAFQQIAAQGDYRLIIAGERKKGYEDYWRSIQQRIEADPSRDRILQKIEFIPDVEIEIYFNRHLFLRQRFHHERLGNVRNYERSQRQWFAPGTYPRGN
jgi:glycosyltransferase involved in cell wall biosynthesis